MTLLSAEVDEVDSLPVRELANGPKTSSSESSSSIFRQSESSYNLLLRILGAPGRYQVTLLFLLGFSIVSVAVTDYSPIFYATAPKSTVCKIPNMWRRVVSSRSALRILTPLFPFMKIQSLCTLKWMSNIAGLLRDTAPSMTPIHNHTVKDGPVTMK